MFTRYDLLVLLGAASIMIGIYELLGWPFALILFGVAAIYTGIRLDLAAPENENKDYEPDKNADITTT